MKKIVGIFSLVLLMSSCLNDFLEIEPLNTVSTEIYWKTENDVRAALNAGYVPLKDAYKKGFLNWYEARSDNFIGSSGVRIRIRMFVSTSLRRRCLRVTGMLGTSWCRWLIMRFIIFRVWVR